MRENLIFEIGNCELTLFFFCCCCCCHLVLIECFSESFAKSLVLEISPLAFRPYIDPPAGYIIPSVHLTVTIVAEQFDANNTTTSSKSMREIGRKL